MIPFAGFAAVWMFNQWAHKSAWKQRKCANVSICRLCNSLVVSSIFMQQEYFLALNLSSSGCSQVAWLFTNKIKNRRKVCWWCNIINIVMTFLPHMPTLFVSQTATQNCSTHGCVFTTYNQFSTITNWKQVVTGSVFFIPFLLRGPVRFLCFGSYFDLWKRTALESQPQPTISLLPVNNSELYH